jgi:hypothetical protein
LPLSMRERRAAALRIVSAHPQWSDRRIAETCGVAPGTVATLRKTSEGRPTVQSEQCDRRVGRDGRARPVPSLATTQRVVEAILREPHASLREIARPIGVSPETVRRVKARMGASQGTPASSTDDHSSRASISEAHASDRSVEIGVLPWSGDHALQSMPDGDAFLEWFGRTSVGDEWRWHATSVPVSRIYMVADESRRRAELWRNFAEAIERRLLPGASSG